MINQNEICFNEVKINCNDIMQIDLSMCSSKGCDGKAYFFLNYYVDLDIHTTSDTYSFQIMNNSQINNLFNYIVSLSVPINDPLGLIRIYRDRNDPVMLNKYLNKINEVFLMRFFIILFIMIFSNNLFSANFEFALGVGAGATTEFSYALDKEENNMSERV